MAISTYQYNISICPSSQHIHVTAITVVRFTKAGAVMKHFMTAPALFIPLERYFTQLNVNNAAIILWQ